MAFEFKKLSIPDVILVEPKVFNDERGFFLEGYKKSEFKFMHGAEHKLYKHNILLINSYHTSRYNINTNVLTAEMFDKIIAKIKTLS